ncbi:MAG: hypothetical protein HUJ56_02715 [Erysipelotrichaceae bacterium]|nr:hypothetical protein [Erysipelotrichaceae bacterium]
MNEMIKMDEYTYRLENGFVRCFLVIGKDKAMWMDSGASPVDLMSIAKEYTDLPIELMNTHGDGDHVGNNGLFNKCYMDIKDYEGCHVKERFSDCACIPLEDGQVIDLGERELEIITIPGHTKGSVAILDKKYRRLFAGDSVQKGNIFLFGNHRCPETFEEALKKLMTRLDDFDEVVASHDEPVLPKESVGLVLESWNKVLNKEVTGVVENVHGNEIMSYTTDYCGFYCEK